MNNCERCGYSWKSREGMTPKACAKCKSYFWTKKARKAKKDSPVSVEPVKVAPIEQ